MKQLKSSNLLFVKCLLLGFTLLAWSCQEEQICTQSKTVQTVSIQEVLEHLEANQMLRHVKSRLPFKTGTSEIQYQKINNSHESLAVINVSESALGRYDRILLLKINGKVESIVFSMTPSQDNLYSGELIVTDLAGKFINGYRVKENVLVSQLIKKPINKLSRIHGTCPDHGDCVEGSFCVYCEQELEEVIIESSGGSGNGGGSTYIPVTGLFDYTGIDQGGNSGDAGMSWDYSDGGGNSGSGCTGGKMPNDQGICTCPEGTEEDPNGICVEAENVVGPSCKSFNFQKTASNWQEASVVNIHFNIVLIEIIGGINVKKIIPISFPQPTTFGMPTRFANGTIIPAGLAAEIGARAISHAIDDTISEYHNLVLNSTDVIRSYFQERLKLHFKDYSNGGRVNFNDMTSAHQATEYKTYGILKDDCY